MPHDVVGLDQSHVVQGWDVLRGKVQTGKRVALISQEDYYETPCIAEYLAAQGKEVTVFHKSVQLGFEIARYSVGMVLKRMEEFNVTVKLNLVLSKVDGKTIEWCWYMVRWRSAICTISSKPKAASPSFIWPALPGCRVTCLNRPGMGRTSVWQSR